MQTTIASEDTGRVVVAILMNPAAHAGSTYKLFGPVELDGNGIAAAMSESLGRLIGYSATDIGDFQKILANQVSSVVLGVTFFLN